MLLLVETMVVVVPGIVEVLVAVPVVVEAVKALVVEAAKVLVVEAANVLVVEAAKLLVVFGVAPSGWLPLRLVRASSGAINVPRIALWNSPTAQLGVGSSRNCVRIELPKLAMTRSYGPAVKPSFRQHDWRRSVEITGVVIPIGAITA